MQGAIQKKLVSSQKEFLMNSFRKNILHPFKFKLFTLSKLPLAFVAGLRVNDISDSQSVVSIKHNYFTKNPFRSMYFASQAMAAELSTGVLVMDAVQQAKPRNISMLVLNMEADFSKKATGRISFTCKDGAKIDDAIQTVLSTNKGETIELKSVGKNEQNEVVSTFKFTWTLKEKTK